MKPKPNNNPTAILHWPSTPLGPLWGELNATHQLTRLNWGPLPSAASATINPASSQHLHQALQSYLNGQTVQLQAQWFAPQGTPFQQSVWQALLKIPHGQTQTYGQIADKLNSAPRAIGGAVGSNPIPILIPCHRVMGQGGKLTGFSAPGGLQTKQWLLKHEGITWATPAKS